MNLVDRSYFDVVNPDEDFENFENSEYDGVSWPKEVEYNDDEYEY